MGKQMDMAVVITKSAAGGGAASWTPAVIIAGCALLFTVASFWWLNARRGRLKSFEPHSFAAFISQDRFRIRFPFVLHNTGAIPIVIQNLRLRFPDESSAAPLPWVATRAQIKPGSDDDHAFPAVFSVAGRTAFQSFQEFGAPSPGFRLGAKDYRVHLEAKLGHRKKWRCILDFTLRAWRISDPGHFITYDNTPGSVSDEDLRETQLGLDFAQILPKQGNPDSGSASLPP
jgi:hypothetical protein